MVFNYVMCKWWDKWMFTRGKGLLELLNKIFRNKHYLFWTSSGVLRFQNRIAWVIYPLSATDFVFDSTDIPEQYSKQLPRHLFTLGLSFTISTSLFPSLTVAVSVCAYIREMPDLLSARFHHIFQSNAVTILLWRQHLLLPVPSEVSYSDHLAINTVPSTVLTASPTIPNNKTWKQSQIGNYSWQTILGPLMTTVFVDEMVPFFLLNIHWLKLKYFHAPTFFGNRVC